MGCCCCCGRKTGVTLFHITVKRLGQWITYLRIHCRRGVDHLAKESRLCHLHFHPSDIIVEVDANGMIIKRSLRGEPVPQIDVPSDIRTRNKKASGEGLDPNCVSAAQPGEPTHEIVSLDALPGGGHEEPPPSPRGPLPEAPRADRGDHSIVHDFECEIEFPAHSPEPTVESARAQGFVVNISEASSSPDKTKIVIAGCKTPMVMPNLSRVVGKGDSSNLRLIVHVREERFEKCLPREPKEVLSNLRVLKVVSKDQVAYWTERGFDSQHPKDVNLALLDELEKRNKEVKLALERFLKPDQVKMVMKNQDPKKMNQRWSSESVKDGLLKKAAYGAHGYEIARECNLPYPSTRTLQKRTAHIKFEPGVQGQLIEALGNKLAHLDDPTGVAPYAIICYDGITHRPGIEFNPGTGKNVGFVGPSLSKLSEEECLKTPAEGMMLFMTRGLALHWKQICGYEFTGSSIDANKLWVFLSDLIEELEVNGIFVIGICSDMASENQAMWGNLGVYAKSWGENALVAHPLHPERSLAFMDDPTHALKNFKQALLKYEVVVPVWFLERHCVDVVRSPISVRRVLERLLVIQEEGCKELYVVKLRSEHLHPNGWQKMRVSFALAVISKQVAAAIEFCVQNALMPPVALIVAKLLHWFATWYEVMSGRHQSQALRSDNHIPGPPPTGSENMRWMTSQERVLHLEDSIRLLREMQFTDFRDSAWHQSQSGMILATRGILEIRKLTVEDPECPMNYLLPARGSTEPCENTFSDSRRRTGERNPGSLKLSQDTRVAAITQTLKLPKGSSYLDGCDYTALDLNDVASVKPTTNPKLDLSPLTDDKYPPRENNVLFETVVYHMASWAAKCVLIKSKALRDCTTCSEVLSSKGPPQETNMQFTDLLNKGRLNYCSQELCELVKSAEKFYAFLQKTTAEGRNGYSNFSTPEVALAEEYFGHEKHQEVISQFPECHNKILIIMVLKKFFRSRLNRSLAKRRFDERAQHQQGYAGKTQTMETFAENLGKKRSSHVLSEQGCNVINPDSPARKVTKHMVTAPTRTIVRHGLEPTATLSKGGSNSAAATSV